MSCRKRYLRAAAGILGLVLIGFIIPEESLVPVVGATSKDWHKDSFWYEPWGASGVHKGIDIFAGKGTPVVASTHQVVLFKGELDRGGKVVLAIGPKWRLHYYAHLETLEKDGAIFLARGHGLGTVGNTGNAQGKPPHLHYSIISLVPLPWHMDNSTQGYKKAFYINPLDSFGG